MFLLTLHKRGRTTLASQDLTRRITIRIALIRPTINLMVPKAEVPQLHKRTHIVLWGLTQILDNIRPPCVPRTPLNGTLPHSRRTSTDMDQSAFAHIAISYPAITSPCKTCKTCKRAAVGETGTHTACPPRPIRLIILPVTPPTGLLLSHTVVPSPPVCAAGHNATRIDP